MSQSEDLGYAPEACTECQCEAGSYHYPGCSGAPYVCPGCHAVGERCAPGCIDAELEAERDWEIDHRDFKYDCVDEDDGDWEYEP